jgi:hypothetical protein
MYTADFCEKEEEGEKRKTSHHQKPKQKQSWRGIQPKRCVVAKKLKTQKSW